MINFVKKTAKRTGFQDMVVNAAKAAGVGLMGYVVAQTPKLVWKVIKEKTLLTITIHSNVEHYFSTLEFLRDQVVNTNFTRTISLYPARRGTSTDLVSGEVSTEERPVSGFFSSSNGASLRGCGLGYGTHYGIIGKYPVIITRKFGDAKDGDSHEMCTIQIPTRNLKVVKMLEDMISDHITPPMVDRTHIRVMSDLRQMHRCRFVRVRGDDSIFLKGDILNRLEDHIVKFESRAKWCEERGVPHHTGIILHGVPGTAKTSLTHALASRMNRAIFSLNIGDLTCGRDFQELLQSVTWRKNTFLVIEDIDAAGANVKSREKGFDQKSEKITLSELINGLDGLETPSGLVVIATTNHLDHLDPALIRPGRFDLVVEVEPIELEQFQDMARFFECDPSEYTLDYFVPTPGAKIRGLLLEGGVEAVMKYQHSLTHPDHKD